jgi:hypothetical protein
MTFAKIILFITAAVWIPYASWLFFDPAGLNYAFGDELKHWTTLVEIKAMYGGAEIAMGIFALLGVLNPRQYMRPALVLWLMIYTGLSIGRLIGLAEFGGDYGLVFGPEGLPNSYNSGALWFLEIPSAILCFIALRKTEELKPA